MMKKLLLLALTALPVGAHEAFFIRCNGYLADDTRLQTCEWHFSQGPQSSCLYFRDPWDGRQLVVTFPHQAGPGQLRVLLPGRRPRNASVDCKPRLEGQYLHLTFKNPNNSGEIWLDLLWRNNGR